MKLLQLGIWWLSHCLVLQINGDCLTEKRQAKAKAQILAGGRRHMWQPLQQATDGLLNKDSCARPTTLRSATDSHVAAAGGNLNGNTAEAPAVTLGNYVYQCAAKREPSPSTDLATTKSLRLQQLQLPGPQQQLTVPAILLQLATMWGKTEGLD